MERTRRAFDRSLSKEPGPKRSRLIDESAAPDRFSNGRAGFVQRPAVSNPGGGVSRAQKDRDSESSDSVRGSYQLQPVQPLYQELVSQYKTALAELTFNSKPIITNLTIIAGENLHAAKAIAGTVCANILEVPSDQKLPSLYLLDSIVKNIGRDYIKYFASKLPEVFCKAYRQVDPSVHPGMRHLFGTWKGVFPPHALQMIEKELGFNTTSNGSSSGITSRPEPQAQRPAHSIHVNPKYLEARQRLQSTRVGGAGSDTSGGPVSSLEDVEPLGRTMNVSSGRSWVDSYAKSVVHHPRDHANDLVRDRSSTAAYADAEYGSSNVLQHKKNGFGLKHGFESFAARDPTNLDSDIQLKQNISNRSSNWKNSEEEEYMWDEMNSISTVRGATDAPAKDHWANDNDYRLDFESHLIKPPNVNDIGSRDYDESADSLPMDLRPVGSGTRGPWSDKLHQPGSMLLGTGKNVSGYSEAFSSGLKSSQSTVVRTPQLHLGAAHLGSQGFKSSTNVMTGPKVSGSEHRKVLETAPSSMQARISSPISHNLSKLRGSNPAERGQTSIGPKDPRKTLGHKSTGYSDQFSESSLPLASQEAYQASTQRSKPQALRSMTAPVSSAPHRKPAPLVQSKTPKLSEVESPGLGLKSAVPQISGSESRSGNSSSDQSNPLTVDCTGQSFTSSSLDAALKSLNSLTSRLTKPSFQDAVPESTAVHTISNPVSSLISSLVAKGLISASKSGPQLSALSEVPELPPARDSEVATCSTTPVSPVPATRSKSLVQVKKELSSQKPSEKDSVSLPASTKDPVSLPSSTKESDSLPASTKESDSLPASTSNFEPRIGFEFKPGVIRRFHPDVISDLSDFPHRCSICGLGLKIQERVDRHMQWHELQGSEQNPPSKTSRSWYVDSGDWVDGTDHLHQNSDMLGSSSEMFECGEQMVPTDESQCACVLCGELFEDFYSRERNEWMFKGAVYLTSPSSESLEGIRSTSDTVSWGPIVHANCISEGSLQSLGMVPDIKVEKDI